MKLLYLHGFRTENGSNKVDQLKTMFPDWTVDYLKYEPHDPISAAKSITEYLESNKDEEIIAVGTSLGGFWARWASNDHPVAAVLLNPSFNPDKTLETGTYKCYDSGRKIEVTKDMIDEFAKYKCNGYQYITALTLDDGVIDAHETLKELEKDYREAITFNTGGHAANNVLPLMKEEILRLHYTLVE